MTTYYPTLENFRRRTKPGALDLYDIYCGILYVTKKGCQWSALPKVLGNGGYTGQPFAEGFAEILPCIEVEIVKRNELKTFVALPQRWVVERYFG